MEITPENQKWKENYKLLVGSILPRPIAFVTTVDSSGIVNAAPFSFFTAICADPMLICFSPMRNGTGAKKDTLANIEATKEFVINIVNEEMAEQMNICAANYSSSVDELDESGLTKSKSITVKPPRVQQSLVHLECKLHEVLHFGDNAGSGSLVIGKVEHIHVDDTLYENGKINAEKLKPIGRMAGSIFTKPMTDIFEMARPTQPSSPNE
ncbi:flavin reductase (DIM6/NTAB) family NADH-FMN oxidoreductase RutF [Cytobacillus horneckiae]|uniref:Flavin reductase family protein n=1 Tax=Cytobacillus horneckiae TaxID=549687 RepID=A0A2N0ZIM8_9BACI|nr:flavin reductase family protein [Cytobacillus horneckiae]MBN6886670.1 flavin reductase family protein [Cytobacillus horneckiae]MCM3177859.1 flavin reductase family protein [Cytobacillus horneckiae]MEC1157335.1 flavin reductase family protein [Cytobacillus horneckiae]MED2935784.1 flavin reductase family protein [Cytobacillus horneckiae]PKG29370.1 flavin reductase family protein [Cytobacillus horneckiae]